MKKEIRIVLLTLVLVNLVIAVNAIVSADNDFYASQMPVELEVNSDEVIDIDQFGDTLTIETIQDQSVQIKFSVFVSCGSGLDIFIIDSRANIEIASFPDRAGDGQCKIRGSLSFDGKNEEYLILFLSTGKDGKYGNNADREQFRASHGSFIGKTKEQIKAIILADSVGIAGNDDSAAQKVVKIKIAYPKIDNLKAEWINEEIVITGETNLAPGTVINTRLEGKGFYSAKIVSVRSNKQFRAKFDQTGIQGGDYRLTIETENGDYIDEFCFNIQPSSVTIGTTAAKQEPTTTIMPASAPATPTPTPALPPGFVWPTPTTTPTPIPAEIETERPYLTILAIILGIILAVLLIRKIKGK